MEENVNNGNETIASPIVTNQNTNIEPSQVQNSKTEESNMSIDELTESFNSFNMSVQDPISSLQEDMKCLSFEPDIMEKSSNMVEKVSEIVRRGPGPNAVITKGLDEHVPFHVPWPDNIFGPPIPANNLDIEVPTTNVGAKFMKGAGTPVENEDESSYSPSGGSVGSTSRLCTNYIHGVPNDFNFSSNANREENNISFYEYDSAEIRELVSEAYNIPLPEDNKNNSVTDWLNSEEKKDIPPSPQCSYTDSPVNIQVLSPQSDIPLTVDNIEMKMSPDSERAPMQNGSGYHENHNNDMSYPPSVQSDFSSMGGYSHHPGQSFDHFPYSRQFDDSSQDSTRGLVNCDPMLNQSMYSPDSGVSESGFDDPKTPKDKVVHQIALNLMVSAEQHQLQKQKQDEIINLKLSKSCNLNERLKKQLCDSQKPPASQQPCQYDGKLQSKPICINPDTFQLEMNKPRATVNPTMVSQTNPMFNSSQIITSTPLPQLALLNPGNDELTKQDFKTTFTATTTSNSKPKRGRGRPKGSKNKPRDQIQPNILPNTPINVIVLQASNIEQSQSLGTTTSSYRSIQPRPPNSNQINPFFLNPSNVQQIAPGFIMGPNRTDYMVNDRESDQPEKEKKMLLKAQRQVLNIPLEKLNYSDDDGDTLLTIGVVKCRYMFRALMERMESQNILKDLINKSNKQKQTPLYLAVATNKPDLLNILIEKGADPNGHTMRTKGSNPGFWMALHVAAQAGTDWLPVLNVLLKAQNIDVNVKDSEHKTALHYAVEAHGSKGQSNKCIDSKETIKALLQHKAKILPGPNDRTPLHIIAEKCDLDLMKFLVEQLFLLGVKRREVVNMKDSNGNTCLHIASSMANKTDGVIYDMIRYLLIECEADFTLLNNKNETGKKLATDKKNEKKLATNHEKMIAIFGLAERMKKNQKTEHGVTTVLHVPNNMCNTIPIGGSQDGFMLPSGTVQSPFVNGNFPRCISQASITSTVLDSSAGSPSNGQVICQTDMPNELYVRGGVPSNWHIPTVPTNYHVSNGHSTNQVINGPTNHYVSNGHSSNQVINGPNNSNFSKGHPTNQIIYGPTNHHVSNGHSTNQLINSPTNPHVSNEHPTNQVINSPTNHHVSNGHSTNRVINVPMNHHVSNGHPTNQVNNGPINYHVSNGHATNQIINGPTNHHVSNEHATNQVLNGPTNNRVSSGHTMSHISNVPISNLNGSTHSNYNSPR